MDGDMIGVAIGVVVVGVFVVSMICLCVVLINAATKEILRRRN